MLGRKPKGECFQRSAGSRLSAALWLYIARLCHFICFFFESWSPSIPKNHHGLIDDYLEKMGIFTTSHDEKAPEVHVTDATPPRNELHYFEEGYVTDNQDDLQRRLGNRQIQYVEEPRNDIEVVWKMCLKNMSTQFYLESKSIPALVPSGRILGACVFKLLKTC